MFCQKCGAEILDGSNFCSNCGNRVKIEENVINIENDVQTIEDTNIVEDIKDVEDIEDVKDVEDVEDIEDFDDMAKDVLFLQEDSVSFKKKFRFPKKIIFIGIPVIGVIVAIILCWYIIGGFFVKWFGSDSDYFAYIEKHSAENTADVLSDFYEKILSTSIEDDFNSKMNVKFRIGEKTFDIFAGAFSDVDFNKLKDINEFDINLSADIEDSNMQIQAGIGVSGKDIINAVFISDAVEGDMYLGIPELSENFIRIPNKSEKDFAEVLESFESAKKLLPDESAVNDLLEKYIDIAFDCISDDYVTVEDGKIVANGIEQDCTVIEVEFTDKLLLEIFVEILENAKDDGDFEEVLDQVQDALEELAGQKMSFDLHRELSAEIETAIDELERNIDQIEKENTIFFLIDYINTTHEVIGRRLDIIEVSYSYDEVYNEVYDSFATELNESGRKRKTMFFVGKAEDGKCGYEFWINKNGKGIKILGKGSETFTGKITGHFELVLLENDDKAEGYSLINFDVKDLYCDSTEISGVIRITVGNDFAEIFTDNQAKEIKSVISMLDPSVEIIMYNESDCSKNTIRFLSNDNMMFEIEIESSTSDDASVKIPNDKQILDSDEMQEWLKDVTVEDIYDRFKAAGISEEILDMIFKASNNSVLNYSENSYSNN